MITKKRQPRGDSQLRILNYIKKEILDKGYPPSVREICDAVGLSSTSTVHGHLNRLEKNGKIRRDPSKPRALEVVDGTISRDIETVPVVGHVAAGQPIFAEQYIEDNVVLPSVMLSDGEHFILKVHGESMKDIGLMDGDYAVIRKQSIAENGSVVVAMIGDDATIKRFFYENNRVRLQPENDSMEPIYARDVSILGIVISSYRIY